MCPISADAGIVNRRDVVTKFVWNKVSRYGPFGQSAMQCPSRSITGKEAPLPATMIGVEKA